MSSFIVSDKHFQIIAEYIAHNTGIQAQIIADKLKRINTESINFRYNEKNRFSKVKFNSDFTFKDYTQFDIIRLIQCWSYQSCENGLSLDFLMMDAYLLSFFDSADIESANSQSYKWSV
jgi:hypothetical protein